MAWGRRSRRAVGMRSRAVVRRIGVSGVASEVLVYSCCGSLAVRKLRDNLEVVRECRSWCRTELGWVWWPWHGTVVTQESRKGHRAIVTFDTVSSFGSSRVTREFRMWVEGRMLFVAERKMR